MAQSSNGVVTTFAWDWATPVPELLSSGATRYLLGAETLGQWDGTAWAYVLPDALGSVRQTVDGAGAVTADREWSPYGAEVGGAQAGLGYTGEWQAADVGLVYLRARWYQAETGRFTQVDPWVGNQRLPLTMNNYIYVVANPMNKLDPAGICPSSPYLPPGECEHPAPDFAEKARIDDSEWIDGSLSKYYRKEPAEWILGRTMYGEVIRRQGSTFNEMWYVGWIVKIRVLSNFNNYNYGYGSDGQTGPTFWHNQLLKNEQQFAGLWGNIARDPDNLELFQATIDIARTIIDAPIDAIPEDLHGYDSFLSPSIYSDGQIDRIGGKPSKTFHSGQNVYRDVEEEDEKLWESDFKSFICHPGTYR